MRDIFVREAPPPPFAFLEEWGCEGNVNDFTVVETANDFRMMGISMPSALSYERSFICGEPLAFLDA